MDDLISEFLTETSESLSVLDVELVKFEQDPNDEAILGNIFRLVHTIKGTCGFLGLPRLESVAHAGENVLGRFRDGTLTVSPEAVTLILRCIDTIRMLLGELEATGVEPEGEDAELIGLLNNLAEGQEAAPAHLAPEASETPATGSQAPATNEFGAPVAADLLAEVEAAVAQGVRAASEKEIRAEGASGTQPAASVPAPPAPTATEVKVPRESQVAASSIRVTVDVLEDLMTLVSELVLTRNALLQMVRGHDDSEFTVPLQRLSHITSDLQEGVMKTRMQPIGNAWAKLPRIVRDLSVDSNKKIDLQMLGAETELDRQVLELIKDPLTHMVRNSADHGLEGPEERHSAGKPETGAITLNAYHEGGHIIIKIADDGRGLDMERIRSKLLANGLATEAELAGMSEQQIQQFIFKPGFSTAEKVTSVSGRGVGMDVVRTNIEKIGGTIELKSVAGRGSTFTIKIPLTLAIVSALIVECTGQRFAIPQISVLELVRTSKHGETVIERIDRTPVLRLRDRLLPLISLRRLLGLSEEETDSSEVFIVVAQVGAHTFGIIVDRVFDTEEIVVKPVAPILRHIPFYSGNTILGDGSVIMILDVGGIATAAGDVVGSAEGAEAAALDRQAGVDEERLSLLVFRAGGAEPKTVPLALVARLEYIDAAAIESVGGQLVVQYRGNLMPLVPFHGGAQRLADKMQPVIVFTDRDRSMGLMVDEIVDIVEDRLDVELSANRAGVIGTAVVAGRATDVVDAGYYLTQAFSDWFSSGRAETYGDDRARAALLVDDSAFFRALMAPLLAAEGWRVTSVASAAAALALREAGRAFDVIVTDIEMPEMDGFEFAAAVRDDPRWRDVPLVVLSSHAGDRDVARGRELGINDHIAKNDREALVASLGHIAGAVTDRGHGWALVADAAE